MNPQKDRKTKPKKHRDPKPSRNRPTFQLVQNGNLLKIGILSPQKKYIEALQELLIQKHYIEKVVYRGLEGEIGMNRRAVFGQQSRLQQEQPH